MRIVVSEFMAPEGLELLRAAEPVLYAPELGERPADLRQALLSCVALIVRNRTRVDAELLAAAPGLRVIGRLGSGLDNLDCAALRAAGIPWVHAPGGNALATAEFTLALILALARDLPRALLPGRVADWSLRARWEGREVSGRCLGLVGLGRVGQALARRARALGLTVLASHPGRGPDDPGVRECGVELVTLPELLRRVDILSLHASLTPATHHLIGRRELALLRPGALLVNTARGGLLDEAALAVALREGWLAGAALDVRDPEPPPVPDPLQGLPGLICTPHIAGLTREAQNATAVEVATGVLHALGVRPRGPRPAAPAPDLAGAPLVL